MKDKHLIFIYTYSYVKANFLQFNTLSSLGQVSIRHNIGLINITLFFQHSHPHQFYIIDHMPQKFKLLKKKLFNI